MVLVEAQFPLKTEGQSTGHAQNMHKVVAIDRPEEAAAEDSSRMPGQPTVVPEF